MQTSHKIELKPNNTQKTYFSKSCGVSRIAYNWGLKKWKEYYEVQKKLDKKDRIVISGKSLKKEFNAIKRKEYPYVMEVTKYACQQPFLNLDKAFRSFFLKKSGYPKIQKKGKSIDSFYIGGDQVKIIGKKIIIPKLSPIRLKEALRFKGKINSVTISRTSDKWFASVQIEIEEIENKEIENKEIENKYKKSVGIDLGIKAIATTSDGHVFHESGPLKSVERKLKRQQRKLSKKILSAKKDKRDLRYSKNFQKQKIKVSKIHYRVSCRRKDILNKITTALVKNYTEIGIEDLNVKGMVKNHNLARAISDVGFGEFRRQLEYKAKRYGVNVIVVDRFFPSSKTCSNCNSKKEKLSLVDRVFKCEKCDFEIDRDLNASINLRNKIGGVPAEFTPVEITAIRRSVYPISVTSIDESGIKHQADVSKFE